MQRIKTSDVVETVTFETETETWLKFRDETETRDLKLETETRDFKMCAFFRNFSKKCCHHF